MYPFLCFIISLLMLHPKIYTFFLLFVRDVHACYIRNHPNIRVPHLLIHFCSFMPSSYNLDESVEKVGSGHSPDSWQSRSETAWPCAAHGQRFHWLSASTSWRVERGEYDYRLRWKKHASCIKHGPPRSYWLSTTSILGMRSWGCFSSPNNKDGMYCLRYTCWVIKCCLWTGW